MDHVTVYHKQISWLHLATDCALIRLDSCVDATVPGQQGRPREPLVTDGAFERLLTGVHLHVVLQDSRPTERSVTHRAPAHNTALCHTTTP